MKIDLGKNELIHFIGIGGIGMSGLALIMNGLGYKVQGSDITNNRNIERLSEKKINVFIINHLFYGIYIKILFIFTLIEVDVQDHYYQIFIISILIVNILNL